MEPDVLPVAGDNETKYENKTDFGRPMYPAPELVDYAEIAMLAILIAIGIPLNLMSCVRSLRKSPTKPSPNGDRSCSISRSVRQQFKLARKSIMRASALEFHLTVANILVIGLYGMSQMCWLLTYSWKGGDVMCRLVKFCDTFCFYATSNIVVCISLDRLYVTSRVDRPMRGSGHRNRLLKKPTFSIALAVAWILAFLCSIPQILVWYQITPYSVDFPDWHQCVTIWISVESTRYDRYRHLEKAYTSVHLLLVFWAPLLIILFSYVLIIARFRERITLNARNIRLQQRARNTLLFQKRANSFHKKARLARESEELGSIVVVPEAVSATAQQNENCRTSAGTLAAVPIVIDSSQAFTCRPVTSTAVKTLTRAQSRTIKTAFWIVLAYIVCWSPYNALVLWRFIDQSFESRFLEFSAHFIVLNAVLNPLIYKIRGT